MSIFNNQKFFDFLEIYEKLLPNLEIFSLRINTKLSFPNAPNEVATIRKINKHNFLLEPSKYCADMQLEYIKKGCANYTNLLKKECFQIEII